MKTINKLPIFMFILLSIETPHVLAAVTDPGNGTIQITAGVATDTNTPEAVLAQAMLDFCGRLAGISDPDTQRLFNVCQGINSADPSLTEKAYTQLSARSVSALTTLLSRGPATVSLEDIGSRLAALRRAARHLNTALLEYDPLNPNSQNVYAGLVNEDLTGGGASADEQGGLYDNRWSGFISDAYVRSKQTETSTLAGFDAKNYGMTLGLDYRFTHDAYAGIATRLLKGKADLNNDAGGLNSSDWNVTFYSTYFPTESFYLDATLLASQGTYDLSRRIDFTINDPVNNVSISENVIAKGSTDGNQYGFSLGSGYEYFFSGPAITTELTGTFKYNKAKLNAYTEDAANGLNLSIDEQTITTELLTIGAQFSRAFSYTGGVLLPQLNIAWKHDFKPKGQDISASFAADPFGTKFVFTTDKRDANYYEVALGVSNVNPGGWSSFLQVNTIAGYENYKQTMVSLGIRKEF